MKRETVFILLCYRVQLFVRHVDNHNPEINGASGGQYPLVLSKLRICSHHRRHP